MKQAWETAKKQIWAILVLLAIGFCIGKLYATTSILADCKVLGMTRFGDVPMGCRVGEKFQ